ncbi:hypothetical protein VM1G_10698 [Cytospora mali]|uniref:Uncharacterized protein n=1 Tax=Cytospora mali TaxID=578113 RepID=A0A194VIY9_CYTMA|nr:hypothetical protein VM1G_10698 [Valsa mali]
MCPTRALSDGGDEHLAHQHALPLLSTADIGFINGLKHTAARKIAEGQGFGGLLKIVSGHLACFERDIRRAGTLDSDQPCPTPPLSNPWGPVSAERDLLRVNTVHISGPGPNDRFEVAVNNPDEAIQTGSMLPQPAETTVNDHIRLLRQYNKTKDVGQQLIGLIAENIRVPVGSLYADQEYGVGPDD